MTTDRELELLRKIEALVVERERLRADNEGLRTILRECLGVLDADSELAERVKLFLHSRTIEQTKD